MSEAAVRDVRARDLWLGAGATAVAIGALAVDHLLGNDPDSDDQGLVDPGAFALTSVLTLLVAVALFGWLVPRWASRGPAHAATVSLVLGVISVVPGLISLWLGIPFVVAGAAVALGFHGLEGPRRRRAYAGLALGSAVIALGAVAYLAVAVTRVT